MNLQRVLLNLKIARRSLANFKLRTVLAVLGVFLGTLSLVMVSGLSQSMVLKTRQETAALGENLLIVQSGTVHTFGMRTRLISQATTLTTADAEAIGSGTRFVEEVTPSSGKTFVVRSGSTVLKDVMVTGTTPNFPRIRNFHPRLGRFMTAEDEKASAKVVVLGHKVASKLFPGENPLGRTVLIRRVPCTVVGVMEEKGSDVSGFDQDNQIFMPLKTFLHRFVNKTYISTIYVRVIREEMLSEAKREIEELMRVRHKIGPDKRDDFTVVDMRDVMQLKSQAVNMITLLGRIAAVVSFAIGGMGILSIMILIVNERRLEIGLRRAVGARRRDIAVQFLTESSAIALLGGLSGSVIGLGSSSVIFSLLHYPVATSWPSLVSSFFASALVGIGAGIYPSRKALAIQPVDVMRSEAR
ncbi:MAG: ABC transporter permease [Desulfosoma sp.]